MKEKDLSELKDLLTAATFKEKWLKEHYPKIHLEQELAYVINEIAKYRNLMEKADNKPN